MPQLKVQLTPSFTPTTIVPTTQNTAGQVTFKLDRTMSYRSINLRWRGVLTTGGTTTTAHLKAGDEWAAIKLIELIANGGNVIRSITGEQLCVMNYLLMGYIKPKSTLSGTAAAYTFDSTEPLWLILGAAAGKSPIDTILNATLLSDLYIRITFGTGLDINTGNSNTAVLSNSAIDLVSDNSFFLDKSIQPDFSGTQIQQQQIFANQGVSGSGTAGGLYQIPVGLMYVFMLFNTKNTGTTVDAPNALGSIIIQSGTNQLYNTLAPVERYMDQYRQYVPQTPLVGWAGATLAVNSFPMFNNLENKYDAWTLLMFPKQKLLSESLNLINYQNCQLYLQNTGGTVAGGTAGTQAIDTNFIAMSLFPYRAVTC